MKYSTFNWSDRGRRGWVIGPLFGRTLTVAWEQVSDRPSWIERLSAGRARTRPTLPNRAE